MFLNKKRYLPPGRRRIGAFIQINSPIRWMDDPKGTTASGRVAGDILFDGKVAQSATFPSKRYKKHHASTVESDRLFRKNHGLKMTT